MSSILEMIQHDLRVVKAAERYYESQLSASLVTLKPISQATARRLLLDAIARFQPKPRR